MTRTFAPAHIINAREKPRILIYVSSRENYAWVEALPGTHRFIDSLGEVDTDEWDVLITDYKTAEYHRGEYGTRTGSIYRIVPPHMWLFRVITEDFREVNDALVDFGSANGGDYKKVDPQLPLTRIDRDEDVPGHQVRRVENLPEALQELVQRDLVPAVEDRHFQFGLRLGDEPDGRPSGLKSFRPFLVGPSELVLACSYVRLDGSQCWVVPDDVPDLQRWFELALNEWHVTQPQTFPGVSAWQTAQKWMTADEMRLANELKQLEEEFAAKQAAYVASKSVIEHALEDQRVSTDAGRRVLLTGQDDALQNATLEALSNLGFDVEDMDRVWPDRERREDFRIRDGADPEWLVIADVTGVQKGAKASKLQTISGYVTKFVLEERPINAPGQWLLVNRLLDRDPEQRGDIFRADERTAFEAQDGLAIDTAALFLIVEGCGTESARAEARAWLRSARGEITVTTARGWLVSMTA